MRVAGKNLLLVLLLGMLLNPFNVVATEPIVPISSEIFAVKEPHGGVFFNGDFELDLSNEVFDVLRRGIALTFIIEVEIEKKRWYWFDKKIASVQEKIRLGFNPLTRQYRVSIGGVNQNFETLDQAIHFMKAISDLRVSGYQNLDNEDYEARARFYLDTSRLPKPFQVTLKKNDDWNLDTGWFEVPIGKKDD